MTGKQAALLKALLEQSTVAKAAEVAGISRNTAFRYLKEPEFQAELAKRRSECISDTVRYLQGKLSSCSEILIDIAENTEVADQVRINAINSVFANCKAMTEISDVITRLEQVEKLMEAGNK